MALVVRKCVVCNRSTNLFNYGASFGASPKSFSLCVISIDKHLHYFQVNSCNACKMFFRRVIFGTYPKFCKDNMKCDRKSTVTSKCRYCRFQICVRAGMMYTPSRSSVDNQKCDSISALINNLVHLDNQRRQKLRNFFMTGDPTMEELAETGNIKFIMKSEDFGMTLDDWGFMTAITTIDYMKKFPFINLLSIADRKIFFRTTYFNFSIFASALRAVQEKREFMSFPDGSDVIPGDKYPISRVLENRIRCRLVRRLIDLKITNEEFLLLSVVFLCNPAIPTLSENARNLLSSCQGMYSSSLFQHCLITYQKSGPSRFTDLLSLCHVINKTFEDMTNHLILFMFYEPKAHYRRIFG